MSLLSNIYLHLRPIVAQFQQITNELPDNGHVLDVGSGDGILTQYIHKKKQALIIHGIEPMTTRVLRSQKLNTSSQLTFEAMSVEDYRPQQRFEVIIFFDVLHHIDYQTQVRVVSSLGKWLTPKGRIIVKEIDTTPIWKYAINYFTDLVMTRSTKMYYRSALEWRQVFEKSGFAVTIKKPVQYTPYSHVVIVAVPKN